MKRREHSSTEAEFVPIRSSSLVCLFAHQPTLVCASLHERESHQNEVDPIARQSGAEIRDTVVWCVVWSPEATSGNRRPKLSPRRVVCVIIRGTREGGQ